MKTNLLLILLGVIVFFPDIKSQYYPNGMEHFWRLEETSPPYIDSYAGINGTSTNSPQRVDGIINYGQSFSNQALINIPASAKFNWEAGSSFTIQYWMKTTYLSTIGNGNVVVIGRDDNSTNLHIWIGYDNGGKAVFRLQDTSGFGAEIGYLGPTLTDDQWHHIAAVRDSSEQKNKLYVDGELIADTLISYSSNFISTRNINIGWLNLTPFYYYNGTADEIAVYSRALSNLEIQRNYDNGLIGKGYDDELAELVLENGRIESGKFKFDVNLTRTGEWTGGTFENYLGNSNFRFLRNTTGLSTDPVVTLGSYFNNASYSAAASISGDDINVELSFSSPAGGALPTAINSEYLLFTVEISISDITQTSGVEWVDSSTTLFDGDNQQLHRVLSGDLFNFILPVELSSFSAEVINGYIELSWNTETESNNYGFEIERSKDNSNWEKIGFVPGYGSSSSSRSYQYKDKANSVGKLYYRLKQLDLNGLFEYSNVINVDFFIAKEYNLEQNFPNPFNPSTVINFSIPVKGMVNLAVYNLIGEEIAVLINDEMEEGFHTIQFNISEISTNLASGTYFYRLRTNEYVQVRKMILEK